MIDASHSKYSLTGLGQRLTMPGMNPDELKARREALDMTQAQLAEALGVDVMTVSRWERGARPLSPLLPLALKGLESEIKKSKRKTHAGGGAPRSEEQ